MKGVRLKNVQRLLNKKLIKSRVMIGKLINYGHKHRFLILMLVTFSSLFVIITAYSTELVHALYFGDDVRVGKEEFSVLVGPTQIAATEKGDVYVVWVDKNNIFFSSSHDNGTKFGTPKVLSENYSFSSSPQIAATEKGDVYVVWVDKNITSGDGNIIFRASKDSGNNFAHKNVLSGNEHLLSSSSPQIAATEKGDVYVVWVDKNIVTFRGSNSSGLDFDKSISLNPGDSKNYRLSLNLSAKDVNQLHTKIYYYDSGKKEIKVDFLFHGRDGTFTDNVTNLFSIPSNTSSIKVQMWVRQNPLMNSSYSLYEAKIFPNTSRETTWTNDNIDMQTLTGNVDKAMSNNGSIKVDVKQGNATNWSVISTDFISVNEMKLSTPSSPQIAATEKGGVYVVWVDKNITSGDGNIIFRASKDSGNNFAYKNELSSNEHLLSYSPQIAATEKGDVYVVWVDKNSTSGDNVVTFRGSNSSGLDFDKSISLNPGDSKNYRLSLNLSAENINQLHSKIYYYDSGKKEIKVDFLFHGRDGTFTDNVTNLFSIPSNTSSIKVQMWVRQNPLMNSSYSLYEAKIIPNISRETTWTNDNIDMQTLTGNVDKAMSNNGSIKVDVKQGNATNWSVISTDFISVNEMKLSTPSSPQIAATEKGGVYVVWVDKNSTYFTSNLKNQTGFGSHLLLSEPNKLASSSQIVATEKDDVYVIWVERNVQFKEILDRSTIIGETIGLNNISSKLSLSPQIVATEKGDVYVLWISKNNMPDEEVINFKRINKFFFDRNR